MSDLLELVKQITDLKLENAELKRTIRVLSSAGTKANLFQDPPKKPVIMPFLSGVSHEQPTFLFTPGQEKEIIQKSRNIATMLSALFAKSDKAEDNRYSVRNSKGQFAKPKYKK
ncbi:MAG: hypothetical protein ACYC97_05560 [Metallibacterium sp.]